MEIRNKYLQYILYTCFCCLAQGWLVAQVPGSFVFEGETRTYTVYLPDGYEPGDRLPLLFALHGLTQTGNIMMQFTGFNAIADQYGFVVAYPDGLNNTWNVGFAGGANTNDVGFLSALIDTLHQAYDIDLDRVYSTGYSNGGFMSYRLACELGDRIAAIASVAGTMTDGAYAACQPVRSFPVMHVHGTNDFVVFYNGGFGNKSVEDVLLLWRNNGSCPQNAVIVNLPDLVQEGSTVQTHTWSPCNDSASVVLFKVINGGHTWPGSVGTTGVGNTNRDINASDEIWKFVSHYSLDVTTGTRQYNATGAERIYPNPCRNGTLNVEYPLMTAGGRLEVCDISGRLVRQEKIAPGTTKHLLNTDGLTPGMYLVRITGETVIYCWKVAVQ